MPTFFAQKIDLVIHESTLLFTFLSFNFATSLVYILNDYFDLAEDRDHPTKSKRPLAAGSISRARLPLLVLGLIIFLIASLWLSRNPIPVIIYLALNIAYTLRLKQIAILDIVSISIGFVLRIIAGAIAAGVILTHWLVTITFLAAMFLALGKRRSELILSANSTKLIRKSLAGYNLEFINLSLILLAGCTLVFYLMYCMSAEVALRIGTDKIYYTSFFVIIGIIRFFQVIIVKRDLRSPVDIFLSDRFLQVILLCWIFTFYLLIY